MDFIIKNRYSNIYILKEEFYEILKDFNFKLIHESQSKVIWINAKCGIDILDTEDGSEIRLFNPKDPEIQYEPNLVYESLGNAIRLNWNTPPFNGNEKEYFRLKFRNDAQTLKEGLFNVLFGDFTWEKMYRKLEKEERILISKILQLDSTHPITQLFN